MNLINISKTMKEHKYLLLGLSFFFFNISFASCRNQKVTAVAQSDSVEENESKNSNLLEIIRSHKYIYGGVRMTIDVSFSIMDTQPFPFNDSLLMVTGVHDQLGPTYSFIVNTENKQAILLPSNRGCVGFTSEEGLPICLSFRHMLMASLADILSFLFMMKKETSSRKCRLKIIKMMRSNDSNRIDNQYSAAQESIFSYSCISLAVGKNCICTFRYARCRNI